MGSFFWSTPKPQKKKMKHGYWDNFTGEWVSLSAVPGSIPKYFGVDYSKEWIEQANEIKEMPKEIPSNELLWYGLKGPVKIKDMETSHIANVLNLATQATFNPKYIKKHEIIPALIEEFEKRTDVQSRDFDKFALAYERIESMRDEKMTQIYNIRIQSPFILTAADVKKKIGIGYKVLEVAVEKDLPQVEITNIESAVEHIVKSGYKALIRAHHPDLGGDPEKAVILNRAKKELLDLLEMVKEK